MKGKERPANEMTHEEALRSLQPETLAPCYLVYGEEPFFINQVLLWFRQHVVLEEVRDLHYHRLEGDKVTPEAILLLAKSTPMLGGRNLIILDNAEKIKDPQPILSYVQAPARKTVMVFVAPKPDMRTKLFSTLKSLVPLIYCRPLYENEVAGFIRQEADRQGVHITQETLWHLKEALGKNPYLIQNELQKLSLIPSPAESDKTEGKKTSLPCVGSGRNHTVFELTEAIGEKNLAKGLAMLSCLLSEGEHPLIILTMLARHFRMMASAKEAIQTGSESEAAKKLSMPPSRAGLFLKQLRSWTSQEIRSAFDLFRRVDGQLKGGRAAPVIVLEGLVGELCNAYPATGGF